MISVKTKKILCYAGGAVLGVGFVLLGSLQIPELRYDLSGDAPLEIASPAELAALEGEQARFVAIGGKGDFRRGFQIQTHGVAMYFFTIHPYDMQVIVRSMEKPDEQWRRFDRFLGRLKPFRRQPFARRVEQAFGGGLQEHYRRQQAATQPATDAARPATAPTAGEGGGADLPPIPLDQLSAEVPPDAWVLFLYDTPGKGMGWTIAALAISGLIVILDVWLMFFVLPRRVGRPRPLPIDEALGELSGE